MRDETSSHPANALHQISATTDRTMENSAGAGTTAREFIFVLGMGRSGTSALTRVLSLCNVALPQNLLPANADNQRGYWEPMDVIELNDRFLLQYDANWYEPSLKVQHAAIEPARRQTFVSEIVSFLEGCPERPVVVIKEPRITALTDYWFEAALRMNSSIKVVVAVRHPAEVAASLAARDGVSLVLSSALWLKYNLLAERASRKFPRVFVDYGNLLDDWRRETGRIASALDIGLEAASDAEIARFLSRGLRHQVADNPAAELFEQNWIAMLHAELSDATRDLPLDPGLIDTIFAAFANGGIDLTAAIREFETRFAPSSG
jgi:hypothetical protein